MTARPTTVQAYLAALPPDRRATIEALREVIRANIDPAFEEGIQYGMIGYYLPHSVYPAGYHCDPKQPLPFASIASQKNHIGLYLFCVYADEAEQQRFRDEWLASGKRLDMGKSCVRVKHLDDVPLDVLARAFRRIKARDFVASYEAGLRGARASRTATTSAKTRKKAKTARATRTATKTRTGNKATTTKKSKTAKSSTKKTKKTIGEKAGKKVVKRTSTKTAGKAAGHRRTRRS